MPRETVGAAYVRIIADGTGLSESIRKELEKNHKALRQIGKDSGGEFSDGFTDEFNETGFELSEALAALERERDKMNDRGRFFAEEFRAGFEADLARLTDNPDIGKRMADNIGESFRKRGFPALENIDFTAEFDRAVLEIDDLVKSEQRRLAALFKDLDRQNERLIQNMIDRDKDRDKELKRAAAAEVKEVQDHARRVTAFLQETERQRQKDAEAAFKTFAKDLTVINAELEKALQSGSRRDQKFFSQQARSLFRDTESLRRGLQQGGVDAELFGKRVERLATNMNRADSRLTSVFRSTQSGLNRLTSGLDSLGDGIGRVFGKGSRNDFVNAIGSIIGGIVKLPTIIPKALASLAGLGVSLAKTFTDAGGGLVGLIATLGQMSGAIASAAAGLLILSGIATLVSGILGVLAAAASLLTAVITALASSITFALIGAVGGLAAILLPVVAGLGVFVAAIVSLAKENKAANKELTTANKAVEKYRDQLAKAKPGTDAYREAQKKLKDALNEQRIAQDRASNSLGVAFEKLKTFAKDTGKIAATRTFANLGRDINTVLPTLDKFKNITGLIGDAISKNITGFAKVLTGPEFKGFLDTFGVFGPRIIVKLGDAFNHLFSGLSGLFTALLPFGERLANVIDRIAIRFDKFINSKEGQKTVTTFMNEAFQSAKLLLGVLGTLIKDIAEIFSAGRPTGDTFLTSINDSLLRFNDYLKSSKGRDDLRRWFKDAVTFVGKLGRLMNDLVGFFNNLDTETARKNLFKFIDSISTIGEAIGKMVDKLRDFGPLLLGVAAGFAAFKVSTGLIGVLTNVDTLLRSLRSVPAAADAAALATGKSLERTAAQRARLGAGLAAVGTGLAVGGSQVEGAGGKALTVAGLTAIGASIGSAFGPIGTAVGAAAGAITGLIPVLTKLNASLDPSAKNITALTTAFVNANGPLRDVAISFLSTNQLASGVADQLAAAGVSIKDAATAITGTNGDFNNLIARLANKGAPTKLIEQVQSLRTEFERAAGNVGKVIDQTGKARDLIPSYLAPAIDGARTLADFYHVGATNLADMKLGPNLLPSLRDLYSTTATATDGLNSLFSAAAKPVGLTVDDQVTPTLNNLKGSLDAFDIPTNITLRAQLETEELKKQLTKLALALSFSPMTSALSAEILHGIDALAAGAVVTKPGIKLIGEQGAEAVVPLDRPLSQVDPAVRWLSAIAQGKAFPSSVSAPTTTIDFGGITLLSPSADPVTVAREFTNELVAKLP